MEPRAFSASPVGLNFLVIGYGWLAGDVIFDPTLPISDVQATAQGPMVGIGRTFNLFGDLGLVTATVPYSRAHVTGKVFEQSAEANRSGLADARFRLSANLKGNRAMSPSDFAAAPPRTIVGASITVLAPVGQYDETKLINLGTHRWAFKPEAGVSVPRGRWHFDGYAGVWLATENRRFFPGDSTRAQDPVVTIQGHVSYEFQPRLWVAVDGTSYHGGKTRVDEDAASPALNNSRAGVVAAFPTGDCCQVKIAYSSGVTARIGGNFKTVSAAWQISWLSGRGDRR